MRPPPAPARAKAPWRIGLGAKAHKAGHAAEWLAAALLMAKGYQVLGFRLKAGPGEIDLLARRGRTLALVEVKRRESLEAALDSLMPDQRVRLLRAGRTLVARRRGLQGLDLRLDLFAFAPGRWPRHFRGLIVEDDRTV